MPELEIHSAEHGEDSYGQRVGVLAALLAVALAITTIASHRAHTDGVILKAEANDKWAFFQAKSIKAHTVGLGEDLLLALSANSDTARKAIQKAGEERKRYDEESQE